MSDLRIFSISDVADPPNELLRRQNSQSFYQFIQVPLPDQLIVFVLGKFPESEHKAVTIEASIQYRDEHLSLGSLSKGNRALCFEKTDSSNIPSSLISTDEKGMAKLVLEVLGMKPASSSEEDVEVKDTKIKNKSAKKKDQSDQEKNESTPQVSSQNKDPMKPAKQKRRSSVGKEEKTPTGPSAKKQRKNTRVRGLKSKLEQTSDGIENKENASFNNSVNDSINMSADDSKLEDSPLKSPNRILMSPPKLTKTTLSICKDVTSRAAPNPSSRWGHSLCMIHDKMAVLVGGQGERQQLSKDSVWALDPVTRKWRCPELKSENQKPEYRMGHTATYDPMVNCIYVYGGSKNLKWFHDVHMLDIDDWKWQQLKVSGKAPTRAYHSATLYRNELWIFGGVYPRPDPQPDGCSNEVHIFSPVMENWYSPIVKGEKPIARSGHSATLIKDQLVMFGGWDAPYVYNDLHILDLSIVEWSQPDVQGTPPAPRSWHASCALSGNRILIHGGYDGNLALDDTHIFNLDMMTWIKIRLDPKPIPRAGHQAVCLPYCHENDSQDEVLIFGGGDNDGAFFRDLISANIAFCPEQDLSVVEEGTPPVLTSMEENVK